MGALPLLLYAAGGIAESSRSEAMPYLFPSEVRAREMAEGKRMTVLVTRLERDQAARTSCIRIFGTACDVCGFDFEKQYGKIGSGFIHVHHLNPLAGSKGRRKVNPRTDLRPVCPNCHEMLHKKEPPYTIEELKELVSNTKR